MRKVNNFNFMIEEEILTLKSKLKLYNLSNEEKQNIQTKIDILEERLNKQVKKDTI